MNVLARSVSSQCKQKQAIYFFLTSLVRICWTRLESERPSLTALASNLRFISSVTLKDRVSDFFMRLLYGLKL